MGQKNILGLDLGTNSIGWAVISESTVSNDGGNHEVSRKIACSGSRIIPMDAAILGDFARGNAQSQTAERTRNRSVRRLYERSKLRRERLHRVLALLGFLPEHYACQLDRYGKFVSGTEPKLSWDKDADGKHFFVFQDSFEEMLEDFHRQHPNWLSEGLKVPYDWTLYYLRKKALTQRIRKEELAWILLNFNQKRGYYQSRSEEEQERPAKTRQYFERQEVREVIDTLQTYKGLKIFEVVLANGVRGKVFQKEKPDWEGKEKDIIVTVDIDKDGKDKHDEEGNLSCRFRIPLEKDWDEQWKLVKDRTEADLQASGETIGAYIYDSLLHEPAQKIRGKLVRTIERKYYKDELWQILEKQKEFHPEFQDRALYEACVNELYPQNEAHRDLIAGKDLVYLLVEDILFYQRPLKSKKSLISACPYEYYVHTEKETGETRHFSPKCIAKSHPLFQEFRLWQFLSNLRIYQRERVVEGKVCFDVDVTSEFLGTGEDYADLFDWLNERKSIKQDTFFKYPAFGLSRENQGKYRWNYVEDKVYPANETRTLILERLGKAGLGPGFLTQEIEESLWHILYSVSDKYELEKALHTFAGKHGLDDSFVQAFQHTPPFEKDYGAYSAKAIKKLLPW